MSGKKPTVEELWERVGYAYAAYRRAVAYASAAVNIPDAAACERGAARWKAEHPEVRA
jgi:hypothetical protein